MKWLSDYNLDHLRAIAANPDFDGTKYRIVKELARGGMGTVYLAHDLELDRQVAVKVLNVPEATDDLCRRMIREAQIIAKLEHPGILPVHDVGSLPDGRIFYAMKLVRGSRLDEYCAQGASLKDRLRKFQSACEAVAFAHAHDVVHRDLKPQNIMIGAFGEVLVLDWGVAKVIRNETDPSEIETLRLAKTPHSEPKSSDTEQGTVIGTRYYMSPEQAKGDVERIDARSDVYSLGAILYFLLTNHSPSANSTGHVLQPRSLNSGVPKPAEAVCLKAMASDPAQRYATAAELAADIGQLLDAEPVAAYRESILEKTGRWLRRNRFFVLLVLAYLLMRIFFLLTAKR